VVKYVLESDSRVNIRHGYFEFLAGKVIDISPCQNTLIGTGFRVSIPRGQEGLLYLSPNMLQKGLLLTNWVGTIDSDYRGEVKFIVKNLTSNYIKIVEGEVLGYLTISMCYRTTDMLPRLYSMYDVVIQIAGCCRMPVYTTDAASGADVFACIDEPVVLEPLKVTPVDTGLTIRIPDGYEMQVRPRSGLAAKHQVTVIPQFYRGPIYVHLMIYLINLGSESFTINPGDRVAQVILTPFTRFTFQQVAPNELDTTERGESGFGSTGI